MSGVRVVTIVRKGKAIAIPFDEHGRIVRVSNEVRFWAKVDKSGECWLWTGGLDKDGYGKFTITLPPGSKPKQRHVRAHRYAWELANNRPFPPALVTLHTCDTPRCVRPDHLRAGTQAENRADCVRKGRTARGENSGWFTKPERMPRGDRHWTKLHPERIARGDDWRRQRGLGLRYDDDFANDCDECGLPHSWKRRSEILRRCLGMEPAEIRAEWSHFWPDDQTGRRRLGRDLARVRAEAVLEAA